MGDTLGIIPCSKEKIWDVAPDRGAVPAKDAYRSAFHRYARGYAQVHCDRYIIFSAKYGLMEPSFSIEGPYDITFSRPSDPVISMKNLQKQACLYRNAAKILVLCPSAYAEQVSHAFEGLPPRLVFPLQNIGGFGAMHRFLKSGGK